ncbi:MAG: C4-type zinc ribbon domain-containing protein [Deltaproteobacteria bacterium]|nr:C4-type zinc ribbon domain-containing protein [Deltaproteobacteria bacterium]
MAEYERRKAALSEGMDRTLMRRYEGLRKLKAGVAIVKADGGVCQGCNMSVAPRIINTLQRNEELVFCSNCQRILYWEGEARVNRAAAGGEAVTP